MKDLDYGRGTFSTSEEIADAMVTLDVAFWQGGKSGRVEIATETPDGVRWVHVPLGGSTRLEATVSAQRDAALPIVLETAAPIGRPAGLQQALTDDLAYPDYDWL